VRKSQQRTGSLFYSKSRRFFAYLKRFEGEEVDDRRNKLMADVVAITMSTVLVEFLDNKSIVHAALYIYIHIYIYYVRYVS